MSIIADMLKRLAKRNTVLPVAQQEAQELEYLLPLFNSFPQVLKIGVDVGCHQGGVTRFLANHGFKVLALEPNAEMKPRIMAAAGSFIGAGQVQLSEVAASDADGTAEMFFGRADGVSSLESKWTTIAFPEEFVHKRVQQVSTRRLSTLLPELGIRQIGFLKIDTEGHDHKVLMGLFDDSSRLERPAVIMFEGNQRFPQQALECLRILRGNGYKTFDIFIKTGEEMLAAKRFDGQALPAEWRGYGDKYFYVNIIAYASEQLAKAGQPSPSRALEQDRLRHARGMLQRALVVEKQLPASVHKEWRKARGELRDYIFNKDFSSFLQHPICRHMFFRTGWSPAQEYELHHLQASEFGSYLLQNVADPVVGQPEMSPRLPNVSTNMLGMMYYLLRVKRLYENGWPHRVTEVGGGYGAFGYLFCLQNPTVAYAIVDLPEMLAFQHYFLSLALPQRKIQLATSAEINLVEGGTTLIPVSLVSDCHFETDLCFSTFALSEMPRRLQLQIEKQKFWNAKTLFLAGQLRTEAPQFEWVAHGEVVGAVMEQYKHVMIERFHIGNSYLLQAQRANRDSEGCTMPHDSAFESSAL
jgi:putative sugar O-methyltransferase